MEKEKGREREREIIIFYFFVLYFDNTIFNVLPTNFFVILEAKIIIFCFILLLFSCFDCTSNPVFSVTLIKLTVFAGSTACRTCRWTGWTAWAKNIRHRPTESAKLRSCPTSSWCWSSRSINSNKHICTHARARTRS